MNEFLKLAYELLGQMFYNIFHFFVVVVKGFLDAFIFSFKTYYNIVVAYASEFGPFQWVLTILLLLAIAAVIVLFFLLIIYGIRKKLARRNEHLNEEELLQEIGSLNRQVIDLIDEKNKLMAMKVSQLGLNPGDQDALDEFQASGQKKKLSLEEPRFAKLALVDERYQDYEPPEFDDEITLQQFIDSYRSYACSRLKLYYSPEIIRYFVAGMASSKILILEGVSGTGKTSLPYSMSRFLQNNATVVSVQPSFRERTELLGYFNEFTKRFNETEFLRGVYEAGYRQEPSLIVLDEMNLARIEYYFAEMLSVLEMPSVDEWVVDLVPVAWENDPRLLEDGKLKVSPSLWFVGTANNDDSTFTITDKVYDRAIPIEINERGEVFEAPDTEPVRITAAHLEEMFQAAREQYPISEGMRTKLAKLDGYLTTRFKFSFGNRIQKQINSFVPVFVACGGTEGEALDYLIARKILKKFESMNISYVRDEIKELILFIEKTFGKTGLPMSKKFLVKIQNVF